MLQQSQASIYNQNITDLDGWISSHHFNRPHYKKQKKPRQFHIQIPVLTKGYKMIMNIYSKLFL